MPVSTTKEDFIKVFVKLGEPPDADLHVRW